MPAKDGAAVTPHGNNGVANSETNRQQHLGRDGKSVVASPFGTMKPMSSFSPYSTTTAPPTPAYSQTAPAFGVPSPVRPIIKQERPSLSTASSFGDTPTTAAETETEGEAPPAKRMKLDFTDILRIEVGPQRRAFHVPRKLATSRSPLIARNLQEAQPIFLPDDDPQVFSIWLQIILQGQVVIDDDENVVDRVQMWNLLVRTYLLATRLGDVQCMNVTVDDIVRRLRQPTLGGEPISQAVKYTFENTTPDSKACVNLVRTKHKHHGSTLTDFQLRRVFIDFAVYRTSDRNLFSAAGSNDFLSEVVKEYMNWRDIQSPASGWGRGKFGEDLRRYHVKDAASAAVKK